MSINREVKVAQDSTCSKYILPSVIGAVVGIAAVVAVLVGGVFGHTPGTGEALGLMLGGGAGSALLVALAMKFQERVIQPLGNKLSEEGKEISSKASRVFANCKDFCKELRREITPTVIDL